MKSLKKLLLLLLVLSIAICATSCVSVNVDNTYETDDSADNTDSTDNTGDTDDTDNSDNTGDNDNGGTGTATIVEYTVTVLSPLGVPVPDVTVSVHLDNGSDYNVCTQPVTTDINGRAVFNLEIGKAYSAGITGYPSVFSAKSGNNRAERYALEITGTIITLDTNNSAKPSSYDLGDFMANFTVTDIDGNSYELYELLKTKKAVVLNFWFYNCGYCVLEFPALNAAYNANRDTVEVLAVNDVDGSGKVNSFAADKGLTLDMPVVHTSSTSAVSNDRFETRGYYPATVIINCYGQIAYVHSGAITSADTWDTLFDYFTSDTYDGSLLENINDIL